MPNEFGLREPWNFCLRSKTKLRDFAESSSFICLKSVSMIFEKFPALDNFTLSFDRGVLCLLGHNGAGKTTLINVLTGVYEAT